MSDSGSQVVENSGRQPLATVPQVATYLHLTRPAIYALMRKGMLGSVRLGGARRIPWSEVDRMVAEQMEIGSGAVETGQG